MIQLIIKPAGLKCKNSIYGGGGLKKGSPKKVQCKK